MAYRSTLSDILERGSEHWTESSAFKEPFTSGNLTMLYFGHRITKFIQAMDEKKSNKEDSIGKGIELRSIHSQLLFQFQVHT